MGLAGAQAEERRPLSLCTLNPAKKEGEGLGDGLVDKYQVFFGGGGEEIMGHTSSKTNFKQ